MTGRRIVSIFLPHFAMERWQKQTERTGVASPDDVAVVLATEGPHGPVIHAANRAARLVGIVRGARVVDMRAICPDLRVEYADVAGDRRALDRLMLWARRWCPWTVVDGPDGLIFETTGADHLWGGEAAMLVEMETRLSLLGLTAQLAAAPTWGAAWALTRYGPVRAICIEGETAERLALLPVAALRLDGDTLLLLQRLGLKTIATLAEVPRLSLTRRFVRSAVQANPLQRLDQAMGILAEPVASVEVQPRMRAEARLAEPIQDPTHHLPSLCESLCAQLAHAGLGCRRLYLTVYRTDGEVSMVDLVIASGSRDARHLHGLFKGKLDRINPGFGFDLITLDAGMIEPLGTVQKLLDGAAQDDVQLPQLVDRLVARFGSKAIKQPVLEASHVPERAESWGSTMTTNRAAPPTITKERPIRMLTQPEEIRVLYAVPEGPPAQFIWRRQTHRVARYEGPERIAPEWWKDRPGTRLRDYFKIEDQAGRRFWLYREGLHEDGRGGDPRWFLHGMFA
jgi:protein ImuB